MPRLSLNAAQRAQLNDWINGGPTDPLGITNWIAENCPVDGPRHPLCDQQEGERDFYQKLLNNDGRNVNRTMFTNKELTALGWVATSLDDAESRGLLIEPHQEQMRLMWSFVRNL